MKRFGKSLRHAMSGLHLTLKSERNFRIHLLGMALAIIAGLYLKLSMTAWGLVIFSIGFVLMSELFNTALERLGDEIAEGSHKPLIKYSKDIAAAAVFMAALTALIIGILVLIIPLFRKWF
jgi:diacylglycerol kinase